MKKFALILMLLLFVAPSSLFTLRAQAPQKFNYQAVARQGSAVFASQTIDVKLSLLQGGAAGTQVWTETQTVTTNAYGLFALEAGSVSSLTVDWSTGTYWLKVEIDLKDGNGFSDMGSARVLSVPYALYAEDVANKDDADADPANEIQDLQLNGNLLSLTLHGTPTVIDLGNYVDDADANPANEIQDLSLFNDTLTITNNGSATQIDLSPYLDNPGWTKVGSDTIAYAGSVSIGTTQPLRSKLAVQGDNDLLEDPLFEVKRKDGQPVFAVYPEGVRIYVSDLPVKGSKGGFAIGGFDAAKGITNEYLRISPDSVRIYIDQTPGKASKGGFAIGGFDAVKGPPVDLMHLTRENYFIGHESGLFTTGLYNSFLGYQAGKYNTVGTSNVFMGYQTGMFNTIGRYNVFIGDKAGYNNTRYSDPAAWEGNYNCFIGNNTGMSNESGAGNTFIGNRAGLSNTTGSRNTFLGFSTGEYNTTGSYNAFLGDVAGWRHEDGQYNTFVGYGSGAYAVHGSSNVYVGHETGRNMGRYADPTDYNVMVGKNAAFWMDGGGQNTYLGAQTGYGTSGNQYIATGNVFIGYRAGYYETGSNKLYIANSNTSTPLIGGDFSTSTLTFNGNVNATGNLNFGDTSPQGKINIGGNGGAQGVMVLNRFTDDGVLIRFRRDGSTRGDISVAGSTVSYNAFTGSHYAWTQEEIEKGMLVTMTGDNKHLENIPDNEILYGVKKSKSANNPKVLGAYLASQNSEVSNNAENPHMIMAVGNGSVWVSDNGQDIQAGDYLISSDVPGHAMKDAGDFEVAYIVGRAAENIDWLKVGQTIDGVKHKCISVFFESFTIDRRSDKVTTALIKTINEQNDRIVVLERENQELKELKKQIAQLQQIVGVTAEKK